MSNEANPGLLPSQEQMFEMIRFNDYVNDNMVPIKEIVLGPKRMSQKDREYEVEIVSRSYRRSADKKFKSMHI